MVRPPAANAPRPAGGNRESRAAQHLPEALGLLGPVMRAAAGAHHADGDRVGRLQPPANVQQVRRIVDRLQRSRVVGVLNTDQPRAVRFSLGQFGVDRLVVDRLQFGQQLRPHALDGSPRAGTSLHGLSDPAERLDQPAHDLRPDPRGEVKAKQRPQ